jgi:hypothetical protein
LTISPIKQSWYHLTYQRSLFREGSVIAVYVDDAYIQATVKSGSLKHASKWCHMTADSTEELTAFAIKLGLQAKYIQFPGTWKEHFDITEPKRKKAVSYGAIEVSFRDRVMELGKKRMQDLSSSPQEEAQTALF